MEANAQAKRKQNGRKPTGKNPSFPFYTGDWMKDPELRSVSAEARGLWIDLLCLMWEAPKTGFLIAESGLPFRPEHISRMTGIPEGKVVQLLADMEEVGLFSRNEEDGAIYNRRMAREGEISQSRAEAGSKGGSKTKANAQTNTEANTEAKEQQKQPSSSSSSLSLSREGNAPAPPCETDAVHPSLEEAIAYASKIGLATWRAEDEWLKQEAADPPWKGIGRWTNHFKRVLTWWIRDGRPKSGSKGTHGNNGIGGRNRNAGTQNEGKSAGYDAFERSQRPAIASS